MTLRNAGYSKLKARILDAMGPTDKALFEEAHKAINSAPDKASRDLAKRDLMAFLYGNPGLLKDRITIPVK